VKEFSLNLDRGFNTAANIQEMDRGCASVHKAGISIERVSVRYNTGRGSVSIRTKSERSVPRLMYKMGKTLLVINNPAVEREELLNLHRRKDVLEKM